MRDLPAPIVVRKSILASNLCSTTFSGFGKGCTALVDVSKYIVETYFLIIQVIYVASEFIHFMGDKMHLNMRNGWCRGVTVNVWLGITLGKLIMKIEDF